jgi:hypothetical protein
MLPRSQAETIRELAWGRDESEVKMSGRTASIGLEDRHVAIITGTYLKKTLKATLD